LHRAREEGESMMTLRFAKTWAGVVTLGVVAAAVALLCGCGPKQPQGGMTPPGPMTGGPGMQAKGGPAAGGEQVQVKGSDTMLQLSQAWAEEYQKSNPGAAISVSGGGSGVGITALIDGTCQIANASRKVKDTEVADAKTKGVTPKEFIMAYDGIGVIVNKDNPVTKLSIDQLADIFTGKVTNWKAVGGKDGEIVVLSRDVSSGTHVYFKEKVLNKGDEKGKAEYAKSVLFQPSTEAIVDQVVQNPKAIGYVGLGYIKDTIKVIAVATKAGADGVKASVETVSNGTYPISRPLMCYTNGEPSGAAKAFIDWCLGPDGQKVVAAKDFVPLTKAPEATKK